VSLEITIEMSKLQKLCAYCLCPNPETDDHIPPKSFFPKPRPSNMITVPCCENCRKVQSPDDEYFRLAIVSSANVSDKPIAKTIKDAIYRSLTKPNKKGFATTIKKNIFELDAFTESGIYIGKAGGINIDRERIDRVSNRIIRGLFCHEFNHPLPLSYEVYNHFSQTGFEEELKSIKNIRFVEPRKIGKVFSYTYSMTDEDPLSGVWLQEFYGAFQFIGFTRSIS